MHRLIALLIGTSMAAYIGWIVWCSQFKGTLYRDLEVHVTDPRGANVEVFGWNFWRTLPGGSAGVLWSTPATHEGGVAHIEVPGDEFELTIDAPGHAHIDLDPISADVELHRLEVVVPDIGLVRGIVTHLGRPVVGARVDLANESPDLIPGVASGLVYGYDDPPVLTDADGAFSIGQDFPGMYFLVRVCADGFGSRVAGPVQVGDPPLAIELESGGTIEGQILFSEPASPAGRSVLLYKEYNGDTGSCEERRITCDADGRFSIEHVAAGSWLVRSWKPSGTPYPPRSLAPEELPFQVDVRDEETTRVQMDTRRAPFSISGEMQLNGRAWSDGWVELRAIGARSLLIDWSDADGDGRWTLHARKPGMYRLLVFGNFEHAIEPRTIADVVEVSTSSAAWVHSFTWTRKDADVIVLAQDPPSPR